MEDHTAGSWAAFFRSTRRQERAAAGLVMVRGLKKLVADYQTRVPAEYTAASWAPFADGLPNVDCLDVTTAAAAVSG